PCTRRMPTCRSTSRHLTATSTTSRTSCPDSATRGIDNSAHARKALSPIRPIGPIGPMGPSQASSLAPLQGHQREGRPVGLVVVVKRIIEPRAILFLKLQDHRRQV